MQQGNLREEDVNEQLTVYISDMVAKLLRDKVIPDLLVIRDGLSGLSPPYQGKLLLHVQHWLGSEAVKRLSSYQTGKGCSSKTDLHTLSRLEQTYPISERFIPIDSKDAKWKNRELMTPWQVRFISKVTGSGIIR
ncbi:hypothetical protein QFC20_007343 [Naganishia adeliensis]|uniref:Uncharacterized protein n=1 Tax=Naganishia adeliensis TaxID=92952 RepID=A0ACC2V034_9TREE|nr:hypothetical protein QFC20_007343 [Naganishia adeliensis]